MLKLEGPPTNDMDKIEITESGITKLSSELNADKASGPDELPNLPLKNAVFGKIFSSTLFRQGNCPILGSGLM